MLLLREVHHGTPIVVKQPSKHRKQCKSSLLVVSSKILVIFVFLELLEIGAYLGSHYSIQTVKYYWTGGILLLLVGLNCINFQ